jgi:hypothetical protein
MNLHMTRRLEVLAKEIAAKHAPKVDVEATRIFAEVGTKSDAKTMRDWKLSKPLRTVDDVMSDPTDDEIEYVLKLRGGCGCMHPPHRAPCRNCEEPWTEEEAQEALDDGSAS